METLAVIRAEEFTVWSIVMDICLTCLSLMCTPLIVHSAKPFHRGFFCNDDSIRYPYKSSLVNHIYVYCVSTAIAVLTITALELVLAWHDKARRSRVALVAGRAVPGWAVRLFRHVLLYGYGLGCQDLLVNVAKFTVGRLRPHFLAVCKPNVVCNASDPSVYIQDYECTGPKNFAMLQSRLSFPSGHSSTAFYAAVFLAFYLERRVRWSLRTVATKTAVQVLLIAAAFFISLSRIQDYKHHWEDVTVGILLGTLVALFWVRLVLRVSADEALSSVASGALSSE